MSLPALRSITSDKPSPRHPEAGSSSNNNHDDNKNNKKKTTKKKYMKRGERQAQQGPLDSTA
jgi:hypothetical protein